MNMAILLSGGIGSRLRSDIPKQYIRVSGRLLITYALAKLSEASVIDKIMVVADEEWHRLILADAIENKISTEKIMGFAAPGFNRQASILNGMQEILNQTVRDISHIMEDDTVFIHDAARPLLSLRQINECFDALAGHDGVMPVLPMKDTVYASADGKTISSLLDRNQIFAGQAPELFGFRKYYQANMALLPGRMAAINGSAEPAVLAGMDIAMIAGDENNFKITTPQDLERFRSVVDYSESRR